MIKKLLGYLKWDTFEEVKNARQSPPCATKSTFLERILLIPQYIVAIGVYVEICILYYTVSKTNGLLLGAAFCFGFYSNEVTIFSILCALYVGHCVSSLISLLFFFSNKNRTIWLYNLIGEERVRPKIFGKSSRWESSRPSS
jgi:hypothetical protein